MFRKVHILVVLGVVSLVSLSSLAEEMTLFAAIAASKVEQVQILLEAGKDPNTLLADGTPVLLTAAEQGFVEGIRLLLQYGAEIDIRGQDELTALMCAAEKGHQYAVKELVEAGAGINAVNLYLESALSLACVKGHIEIVQYLLEHEPELNQYLALTGQPFLFRCIRNHQWDIADLLIDAGANINLKGYRTEETLISFAVDRNMPEVVDYLIRKGAKLNEQRKQENYTPLLLAINKGNLKFVEDLVAAGANLDKDFLYWLTPLLLAIEKDRTDIALILINAGADAAKYGSDGSNALTFARIKGNDALVAHLEKLGVKEQLFYKEASLHHATIARNELKMVRMALRAWEKTKKGSGDDTIPDWNELKGYLPEKEAAVFRRGGLDVLGNPIEIGADHKVRVSPDTVAHFLCVTDAGEKPEPGSLHVPGEQFWGRFFSLMSEGDVKRARGSVEK